MVVDVTVACVACTIRMWYTFGVCGAFVVLASVENGLAVLSSEAGSAETLVSVILVHAQAIVGAWRLLTWGPLGLA